MPTSGDRARAAFLVMTLLCCAAGCADATIDAHPDATTDASGDATHDAGDDATHDADMAADTGVDAGPAADAGVDATHDADMDAGPAADADVDAGLSCPPLLRERALCAGHGLLRLRSRLRRGRHIL